MMHLQLKLKVIEDTQIKMKHSEKNCKLLNMSGTRGSQTEGTSKYGDKILRKVPSKQLFDSADFSLQGKNKCLKKNLVV